MVCLIADPLQITYQMEISKPSRQISTIKGQELGPHVAMPVLAESIIGKIVNIAEANGSGKDGMIGGLTEHGMPPPN